VHELNWISNCLVRGVPKLRPNFLTLGKKEMTDSEWLASTRNAMIE